MDDPGHSQKSRRELVEELETLRRQVAELAAGLAGDDDPALRRRPRQERQPLTAAIEFIGDFDVVRASGVDLSPGGICFEVASPLTFEMRLSVEGVCRRHRAQLVWMRELEGDRCRMGFRFATPD